MGRSFAAVLAGFAAFTWPGSAHAAATSRPGADGLPLTAVDLDVDVEGPLAELVIDQTFVNDSDEVVDAVYVFPLHEEAAVDAMWMVVGDRVVEGEVRALGEATRAYDAAIAAGHTAALTTAVRPNVFVQRVGNIGPGAEVHVELHVVQPVPRVDGAYELVLPLVTAPRFVTPSQWAQLDGAPLGAWAPVAGPPAQQDSAPVTAEIAVRVGSGLPFTSFGCPSHRIAYGVFGATSGIRMVTARAALDRDFVLRWTVASAAPDLQLLVQDGHLALAFEPPVAAPDADVVPRELVFVIDQSCSMTGPRIELAKRALGALLGTLTPADTLRILQFAERVEGDDAAEPVTPEVLAQARARIDGLSTRGGTYLLDGVLAALTPQRDPARERTVVFLTDGLIGEEREVLRAIADEVGTARLYAFGVGAAPNRWLLDEMARFGGGRTVWLRPGEPPEDAAARFVAAIARPVLTDLAIDWGDWQVDGVTPARLPPLHQGEPLLVTARVLAQGVEPVRITARLGDRALSAEVTPTVVPPGRTIPTTWARQRIADLERDAVWGDSADLADAIRELSLSYRVLSRYTAFVAVDTDGAPLPDADQPRTVDGVTSAAAVAPSPTPVATPSQTRECLVVSAPPVISTDGTADGRALDVTAGLPTPTGQAPPLDPDGSGTAVVDPTTWLIDEANITDPVTGGPMLAVPGDAIDRVGVVTAAPLPSNDAGTGTVVGLGTRHGYNELRAVARIAHLARIAPDDAPLTAERVSGSASGPVVRDHAWAFTAYQFDRSVLDDDAPIGRGFEGHAAAGALTVQADPEHRLSALAVAEVANVSHPAPAGAPAPADVQQRASVAAARWQWFQSPRTNSEVTASVDRARVGADARGRAELDAVVRGLDVRDWLNGRHDLTAGAVAERVDWALGSDWASRWLGVDVGPEGGATRVGGFAEDAWKPVHNLTLAGGSRLDVALGRAHIGPRLAAAWDPWSDQRTVVVVGVGRRYGHVGLAPSVIAPDAGLPRVDEAFARVEREIVSDVAVGASGVLAIHRGVPVFGGDRTEQRTGTTELFARKVDSRRWAANVVWRYTVVAGSPGRDLTGAPLPAFAHAVFGWGYWALPTDPFTTWLAVSWAWRTEPLGPWISDPDGSPGSVGPGWSGGLRIEQRFSLQRSHLVAGLGGSWVSVTGGPASPEGWPVVERALPYADGWGGPRLEAELSVLR